MPLNKYFQNTIGKINISFIFEHIASSTKNSNKHSFMLYIFSLNNEVFTRNFAALIEYSLFSVANPLFDLEEPQITIKNQLCAKKNSLY